MTYDNSCYWTNLHKALPGALKSVGWPGLSEGYNRLKYASESESAVKLLDTLLGQFDGDVLSVLDVGAGIGYFSGLIKGHMERKGLSCSVAAVDISDDALQVARQMVPGINTSAVDLKSVDVDRLRGEFDLVIAFYCLHHIVGLKGYVNAITFSARSVKPGGHLMIMDPILSTPYSRFDTFDYYTFRGNGLPRHLFLMDDLLFSEGFRRVCIVDAVSFLLNGNIEAHSRMGYFIANLLWKFASGLIYPHDAVVNALSSTIATLDRWLKKRAAYSSKICLYEKTLPTEGAASP